MSITSKKYDLSIEKQIFSCFDSEHLRLAIKESNFELQQLSKGNFSADLSSIKLHTGILDHAYYGKSLLNTGTLPSTNMTFGCLFESDGSGKMNGSSFSDNDIILCDENAEMTYFSSDTSHWSSFQFKREDLSRLGIELDKTDPSIRLIKSEENHATSREIQNILYYLENDKDNTGNTLNSEMLYNHILTLYARTLESNRSVKVLKESESKALAKKIYHFVNAHAEDVLQMIDITTFTGKSERTVERIFKKHFGVTPYKYLKLHRLNLIRKCLLAQRESEKKENITQIAVRNGFTQMGYFGREYKKMFAETATETLYSGRA